MSNLGHDLLFEMLFVLKVHVFADTTATFQRVCARRAHGFKSKNTLITINSQVQQLALQEQVPTPTAESATSPVYREVT